LRRGCPLCVGQQFIDKRIDHQYLLEIPYYAVQPQFNARVDTEPVFITRAQGWHRLRPTSWVVRRKWWRIGDGWPEFPRAMAGYLIAHLCGLRAWPLLIGKKLLGKLIADGNAGYECVLPQLTSGACRACPKPLLATTGEGDT
jgi:hypothetical protein